MLTVHELAGGLDLELLSGADVAPAPIRWVHVSEHLDPTPWLSGGELLLTTGMGLTDAAGRREYVSRLVAHGCAGLGFGTGFGFKRVPEELLEQAHTENFPLFEVPYEMPFIAITERAADHLVNEQYAVLQRAVEIQRRVESLILEDHGFDHVLRALASAIGATLIVIDVGGTVLASHIVGETLSEEALAAIGAQALARFAAGEPPADFTPTHPQISACTTVRPLPGGGPEQLGAQWLVAVGGPDGFPDFERFVAQHAVMALSLALMRERTVNATERRLAGDVLNRALSGTLGAAELCARLEPFGIRADCLVILLEPDDLAGAAVRVERTLRTIGVNGLVANVGTRRRRLLCAVVDPQQRDPMELAGTLQSAAGHGDEVAAAVSRVAPREALRRSFHEARCALEVGALGERPRIASAVDLGAYRLLLTLQDDDGLRIYCEEVLGPIERSRSGNGEELLRSLEVYLEHNGSWEAAARVLACHRHTLRYRISRIEELTGRTLDLAAHRIEFWLALRGRELLG